MSTATPAKWLLRRPGESPARLFCFPYSGTGGSMYNRWPRQVGPVEICAVQLPARENRIREPHYGSYQQLADAAAAGLRPYLDRPFGFFGHCGGALSAFATALRLAELGATQPAALFLSSQVAPQDGPFGRFLDLDDDGLRAELAKLTVALGGIAHPDALDFGLEVLRADVDANRRYHVAPPVRLASDIHAIGWSADAEIRPEQMTGWAAWAEPGRCRQHLLEGGHHAFLSAPDSLLAVIEAGLIDGGQPASTGAPAGTTENALRP